MIEWLSPKQFAARVPCHPRTVTRAIRSGRLKARADGRLAAGQLRRFRLMPGGRKS